MPYVRAQHPLAAKPDVRGDTLRRHVVGIRYQLEPLDPQLGKRVTSERPQRTCRDPPRAHLARTPVADPRGVALVYTYTDRADDLLIVCDRELVWAEGDFAGDEGTGVISGVRARHDWDPVMYLRVLACRMHSVRVLLPPRAQDDDTVMKFHPVTLTRHRRAGPEAAPEDLR